jgi:hypothetical protein
VIQNNNPNRGQVHISESLDSGEVQIHVIGDLMPSNVFLQILDIMKLYYEKKSIVFVVYHPDMERNVRESLPRQYYDRIELYSPKAFETKEGLRRAG